MHVMFKINSASHSQASRVGFHQSMQQSGGQNGLRGGSVSGSGAQAQQAQSAGAKGSAQAARYMDKGEFGNNALSGARSSYVGLRQSRQDTRIQNGLREGSISGSEAQHLSGQQARIAEAKSSAMADGKMDKGEFKNLRKLQREASRDIFIARHNGGTSCDKPTPQPPPCSGGTVPPPRPCSGGTATQPAPSSGGTATQPVPSSGGTATQPAPSSGGTATQPVPSSGGTATQPAPSVNVNVLNFLVNLIG
jgi:hypothetical protein